MGDDDCDYCSAPYDADKGGYLRPIGFTQLTEDGPRLPLVKTWCGDCEPGDECDAEAAAAVRASIRKPTTEEPKRRRAPNGQRITSAREQYGETWWWECDHGHDIIPATTCGRAPTRDAAYAALDEHNDEQHPERMKGPTT